MADFIANSTNTVAVRKEAVNFLEIVEVPLHTEPETYIYKLFVKLEDTRFIGILFEQDATLEGLQSKLTALLDQLE